MLVVILPRFRTSLEKVCEKCCKIPSKFRISSPSLSYFFHSLISSVAAGLADPTLSPRRWLLTPPRSLLVPLSSHSTRVPLLSSLPPLLPLAPAHRVAMSTSFQSNHQRVYHLSIFFLVLSFLHFASSSTLIIFSQLWQSSSSLLHEEQMMRFIILKGFFTGTLSFLDPSRKRREKLTGFRRRLYSGLRTRDLWSTHRHGGIMSIPGTEANWEPFEN